MAVKNANGKTWTITPSADGKRWSAWPLGDKPSVAFPLQVSPDKRYLVDSVGTPFLIHGDTPWSAVSSLTDAQIDMYVDDCAAKGMTTLMIQAPVWHYTISGHFYNNVDGVAPFTSMSGSWNWVMNNAYWLRVDRFINRCLMYGILVIVNPAYVGYAADGSDGCAPQLLATSDVTLQAYGAALANRYTQPNIMWCMGGDWHSNATLNTKQWNIITGIRSVRTTDLITAHSGPQADSLDGWSSFVGSGLSFNFCYPELAAIHTQCLASWAKAGPMPFMMGEAIYENERAPVISAAGLRRQAYSALLSGAKGQMMGNNPIWHMSSPNSPYPNGQAWQDNLNSIGRQQQVFVKALFVAFAWWKLVPAHGTTLVTSSLGTGDNHISPSVANDGSFAMVWVPLATTVTINKAALAPGLIRIRFYNTTTGGYTTHTSSTSNSGSINVTTPGECVIVIDAAP